MEAGGNVAWGRDCASAHGQGIVLLLRDVTAVILAQTRLVFYSGTVLLVPLEVHRAA